MPSRDDDVTLKELGRTLADFRAEFRTQVQQLVRADVYRAEQAADRSRLTALEKAAERDEADRRDAAQRADQERKADRRMVTAAILTSALSVVAAVLIATLT